MNYEQIGQVIMNLYAYADGETPKELDPAAHMCYSFMRAGLDRDREKYDARCLQNRLNGAKAWEKRDSAAGKEKTAGKEKNAAKAKASRQKQTDLPLSSPPQGDIFLGLSSQLRNDPAQPTASNAIACDRSMNEYGDASAGGVQGEKTGRQAACKAAPPAESDRIEEAHDPQECASFARAECDGYRTVPNKKEKEKERENEKENTRENANTKALPLPVPPGEPGIKRLYASRVLLTEEEYQKLVEEYGEADAGWMIGLLDDYKARSGKRYASDARALHGWVAKRLREKKARTPPPAESIAAYDWSLLDEIIRLQEEGAEY